MGIKFKMLLLAVGLAGLDRGSVAYLTGWMERSEPRLGIGLGPLGATSSSAGTFICIWPQNEVSTRVR
jgi:hypothetical protein